MYKLLPPETRVSIESEYRSRRVRAMLTLASLLLVFTAVALLPALILSFGRRNAALTAYNAAMMHPANAESAALLAWAKAERQKLIALAPASTPTPYEYFGKILKSKPASVRITSFAFTKNGNNVSAKGVASDRQALVVFQSALVASGDFAKVDFPVDNLTKDKDIDFQFNLTAK